MNINTESCSKTDVKKEVFNVKRSRKDGLILRIHHTTSSKGRLQSTRFLHALFDVSGTILAAANHEGEIFIVDLEVGKFWFLDRLSDVTVMKFIPSRKDELLIGDKTGVLYVVNKQSDTREMELQGHDDAVTDLTFSSCDACISMSASEAVIWDLNGFRKMQTLRPDGGSVIKMALFTPVTHNILICYQDDIIQVWKGDSLKQLKQILPCPKNKIPVKSIAFTENEKAMVVGGHSSNVVVFVTETWTLLQTISLPASVRAVRKLEFVSRPFDGGANKILTILSSGGSIMFYDMEGEVIVGALSPDSEILRFSLCPHGRRIACTMNSGDVRVYELARLLENRRKPKQIGVAKLNVGIIGKKVDFDKKQLKEMLNTDKLKAILAVYGEYPDLYRQTIWASLAGLPNDKVQYQAVIRNVYESPFIDLESCYPLANKQDLRNLKRTLNNVVSWCPFFAEVGFLPLFCYPFVRFFQNEPVLCFEAIIVIIVNYCQFWFEYHPLPPLNILGMIENILIEHDPPLIKHFNDKRISSKMYAWPLLQTAFSEVLSAREWLVLWDHVLSNEPAFLLLAVASYSITNRAPLLSYGEPKQFVTFFGGQNPVEFKRFMSKTYKMLHETTNHPRQYLNLSKTEGNYPKFRDYSRATAECSKLLELKKERAHVSNDERELVKTQSLEIDKLKRMQRANEEFIRLMDLQKLCRERINEEKESVMKRRERLHRLSSRLRENESKFPICAKNNGCSGSNKATRKVKVEEKLVEHYKVLLGRKLQIEKLVNGHLDVDYEKPSADYGNLAQEIGKAKNAVNDTEYLKQLNVTTGLEAIDILIGQVESELLIQDDGRPESQSRLKVRKLAKESRELSEELNELIHLITYTE